MSIGFCLWETGAAEWLAINWLAMFKEANWFVFVMSIAFFVMMMTNFIMNVAAIAISLPVALVIAPYLGVAGEVILFSSLVVAGMPFLLLVGAAPNAIAYDSKQFTTGEFFLYGIPASIILMIVTGFAVYVLWPIMGMPAHRDAIVVDDAGTFLGKVTMIDIFRALEPNYKKMMSGNTAGTLTSAFVMKAVKEFNLWMEPETNICQRGASRTVADVMHTPKSIEYLQEDDTLEKALNLYVMEVHQPLIVKKGETVTGILRFGDMFEVVRRELLACNVD
jgi:hypothetical protein